MATRAWTRQVFLRRVWLPILIGGLALLAFLWSGPRGDDGPPMGEGDAGQAAPGPGLRSTVGAPAASAVIPRIAVHVSAPDGRAVRWQLRMNVETGWRAERAGTGSGVVRVARVPDRPLWVALWAEAAPHLLVVERLVPPAAFRNKPLELRLEAAGRLHGQVRDRAGEPIADVAVEVARAHAPDRPRWALARDLPPTGDGRATTDAQGNYTVEGLALGTYTAQARHFDYCPTIERSIALLAPGSVRRVDFGLEPGFRLKGVLLDRTGGRFGEARLHFLREVRAGAFAVDSWVKTAEDGAFRSPMLPRAPTYKIKLQTLDRGVISLVEHVVAVPSPPPKELDVGLIGPFGTIARFRLPAERPVGPYSLVVSAIGQWKGEPRSAVIANATFDAQGVLSIAGFPLGTLRWSLLRAQPDGREVAVGSGAETLVQNDQPFNLGFDAPPADAGHAKPPAVHAPRGGPSPVDVVLLADGAVLYWTSTPADGKRVEMPTQLDAGTYEILLRQGTRIGRFPFRMPRSAPLFLIADEAGQSVTIRVRHGETPVPRAEITIRGFDAPEGGGTLSTWRVTADADGMAVLHGVPPSCRRLTLRAIDPLTGTGRQFVVAWTPGEIVTLDLK